MRADGIYVDSDAYAPHDHDTSATRHVRTGFSPNPGRGLRSLPSFRTTADRCYVPAPCSMRAPTYRTSRCVRRLRQNRRLCAGFRQHIACLSANEPLDHRRIAHTDGIRRTAWASTQGSDDLDHRRGRNRHRPGRRRPLHDRVDVYDTRSGCMTPTIFRMRSGGYDVIIAPLAPPVPASMAQPAAPRRIAQDVGVFVRSRVRLVVASAHDAQS